MTLFLSTLSQMAYLFLLILIGYLAVQCKAMPAAAAGILSKLENTVLIPALVLGTFYKNFTLQRLGDAGQFFAAGALFIAVTAPLAVPLSRLCAKDPYQRRVYTYGLAFSNFGFMGNAVVSALFPEIFMEYLLFTVALWIPILVWGIPVLLTPTAADSGLLQRLKGLVNPMFVAMAAGMVLGLTGLPLPAFAATAADALGSCMSPVAMLLTGMTIAQSDLKTVLRSRGVYTATALRLAVLPLVGIALLAVLPVSRSMAICILSALAMPLGLNVIVVPAAYGRNTTTGSGMVLVSHLLSCVSIPVLFRLLELVL